MPSLTDIPQMYQEISNKGPWYQHVEQLFQNMQAMPDGEAKDIMRKRAMDIMDALQNPVPMPQPRPRNVP